MPEVPMVRWAGEDALAFGDVRFRLVMGGVSSPGDFVLAKQPELARAFVDLLASHRGADIVELGIFQGGSTALTWLAASPRRLLAVDLDPVPPALATLVGDLGNPEGFHVRGGLDQSDQATLAGEAAHVFGDDPLDLVVDDASHLGGPTRASFDVLFPRLRPGGLYIVEDWNWEVATWAWIERAVVDGDLEALRSLLVPRLVETDPWWPVLARWIARVLHDPNHELRTTTVELLQATGVDTSRLAERTRPVPGDDQLLVTLPAALSLVAAARPDVVRSVEIGPHWIVVERGDAALARAENGWPTLADLAGAAGTASSGRDAGQLGSRP